MRVWIAAAALQLAIHPANSEPAPFAPGDQKPEVTASCENLAYWIGRLPELAARVDMAVSGSLVAVESDGALAYLVICPDQGPQVMCVTYSTNGMSVGENVLMSGGVQLLGPNKIMLDPCLATRM